MRHSPSICRRARAALDRQHDGGAPPRPRLLAHIDGCPSCRGYRAYLRGLAGRLRSAAQLRLAAVGMPDLATVRERAQTGISGRTIDFPRRLPRVLAAAAALVLVAGACLGVYARLQRRRVVQAGTDLLVERVLGASLFEGVEFAAARSTDVESLLDDLGGSRRLFSPPPTGDPFGGSALGGAR